MSDEALELRGVRISHPSKVLWPDAGVTKAALARYVERVGERMLRHLADRPLTLRRCPDGIAGGCFYQRHPGPGLGDAVRVVADPQADASLLAVDSVEGLLALAQLGTVELHGWLARRDRLDAPDRLVIDLDPGGDVAWAGIVGAAREVRERLSDAGLESFCRLTGGKGLHVVAPLERRQGWDELLGFTRALAEAMESDAPDRFVASSRESDRPGRIYVDYQRNARGASAVANWSPRARPGAPLAVPITWDELSPDLGPQSFRLREVEARLDALGDADPWEGWGELRQSVTKAGWESVGG